MKQSKLLSLFLGLIFLFNFHLYAFDKCDYIFSPAKIGTNYSFLDDNYVQNKNSILYQFSVPIDMEILTISNIQNNTWPYSFNLYVSSNCSFLDYHNYQVDPSKNLQVDVSKFKGEIIYLNIDFFVGTETIPASLEIGGISEEGKEFNIGCSK